MEPDELAALLVDADAHAHALVHGKADASTVSGTCAELFLVDGGWWIEENDNSSSSVASTEVVKEPKRQCRSTLSRRRQREEIERLREQALELEEALQTLRAPRETQCQVKCVASEFWRRVAENERRAKQRAVGENARLRHALEAQIRVAKSLERLLSRPAVDETQWGTPERALRNTAADSAVFARLVQALDAQHGGVEAFGSVCGFKDVQCEQKCAQFVNPGGESDATGWQLEFLNAVELPFDYSTARDVIWRILQIERVPYSDGAYECVEAAENEAKGVFRVSFPVGSTEVKANGWFVCRRYWQSDCQVQMWGMWITANSTQIKNQRVTAHIEGVCMVSPLSNSSTLVKACGRTRPQMELKTDERTRRLIADVVRDTYDDALRNAQEAVVSMLLTQHIASKTLQVVHV